MRLDFEKLYADLSEEDREDLEGFRRHVMHFKWFTDICETWEELIGALLAQVHHIRELQAKGAVIVDTDGETLYYTIPWETPVYATLSSIDEEQITFTLTDGSIISAPLIEWEDLHGEPVGRRLILFVNELGSVQGYILAHEGDS